MQPVIGRRALEWRRLMRHPSGGKQADIAGVVAGNQAPADSMGAIRHNQHVDVGLRVHAGQFIQNNFEAAFLARLAYDGLGQ